MRQFPFRLKKFSQKNGMPKVDESLCQKLREAYGGFSDDGFSDFIEGIISQGKEAYYDAINNPEDAENAVIPDEVKNLAYELFYDCEALKSVTIPQSVTYIGDRTFAYCTALEDIKFTGTKEQWHSVEKGENWNNKVSAKVRDIF